MGNKLLSVGLDVGTTSTQMILSELVIENKASAFSVPEMEICQRHVLYQSPIYFTPLLQADRIDGDGIRAILTEEYQKAGIRRDLVDTGAIIITGETARKENAATVLQALSDFAGDFVVATAGPDLESVLAAKGAGAVAYAAETGKTLLHIDIGGGTSNFALIREGSIVSTGCLNVGGRLLTLDKHGAITYISPVLTGIFDAKIGQIPTTGQLEDLANTLVSALEMAAGLRPAGPLLEQLRTKDSAQLTILPGEELVFSFSGGVADCIDTVHPDLAFGDIGPILGRRIRQSLLCRGPYRLGAQTIRATVIGAGSYTTQLSGGTVFYQNTLFPLKNLPVVTQIRALSRLDGPGVLALPYIRDVPYRQLLDLAEEIAQNWPAQPVLIGLQADMAKALGHALALRFPKDKPIVCIDRVILQEDSYLDIGSPIQGAIPIVVKTLIRNR